MLAPTHEEEITQLVASDRKVGKKLPLRLFQIGERQTDDPLRVLRKSLNELDTQGQNSGTKHDHAAGCYAQRSSS